MLNLFAQLDDNDIMASIKVWANHRDKVLSRLCANLIDRTIYKVVLSPQPIPQEQVDEKRHKVMKALGLTEAEASYFVFTDSVRNNAYDPKNDRINILFNDGSTKDLSKAADLLNISVLSDTVEKHLMCYTTV